MLGSSSVPLSVRCELRCRPQMADPLSNKRIAIIIVGARRTS